MKRRDFLKASLGVPAAAAIVPKTAEARPNLEPAPEAIGMLFDSTLCVGCKACVAMCKQVNERPATVMGDDVQWDSARDLSHETYNVIKVYRDGDNSIKDRETNGYAFEKRSCMH